MQWIKHNGMKENIYIYIILLANRLWLFESSFHDKWIHCSESLFLWGCGSWSLCSIMFSLNLGKFSQDNNARDSDSRPCDMTLECCHRPTPAKKRPGDNSSDHQLLQRTQLKAQEKTPWRKLFFLRIKHKNMQLKMRENGAYDKHIMWKTKLPGFSCSESCELSREL